jgi:hypothetical protein
MAGREKAIIRFKNAYGYRATDKLSHTLARQKKLGVVPQDTMLTERSPGIPAWDSLDADHKKVAAHMMEVYAAALSYCDSQMGGMRASRQGTLVSNTNELRLIRVVVVNALIKIKSVNLRLLCKRTAQANQQKHQR